MFKIALGLLAVATTCMAGANIAFALVLNPQGSAAWIATRALLSVFVLAIGVATLGMLVFPRKRPSWLNPGAVLLLALGLATTVKASYHALVGPDPEYWLVMLGLFLVAQALGTLLLFRQPAQTA